MKIAIYSPYLDTFGGGERYMLTIAEVLSKGNQVDLLLDDHHLSISSGQLISRLSKQLNIDLSLINFKPVPMGKGFKFLNRLLFFRKYDLFICLTDGSIFYSTAKKSFLHFQVPFKNINAKGLWGKIKLSSWNLAICNSHFTESHIKNEWPIETYVLYPPVDIQDIKPLKKEKWILSVGRFTSFSKSKKHEEMIKAFKPLYESGNIKGWSLHLAGSVEGDEGYVNELKEQVKELPVTFYTDLEYKKLVELYGKSSIYWHAAGFEEEDPTKMEHFGITTVEAMAGGCVPVVINKGGQIEIVDDKVNGFRWNNLDELIEKTLFLVNDNKKLFGMSLKAIEKSKMFSKEKFAENLQEILKG